MLFSGIKSSLQLLPIRTQLTKCCYRLYNNTKFGENMRSVRSANAETLTKMLSVRSDIQLDIKFNKEKCFCCQAAVILSVSSLIYFVRL